MVSGSTAHQRRMWRVARRRLRRMGRLRPRLRFALVVALTMMALVASLSPLAAAAIRESIIDQEARQVADQVSGLSSPAFSGLEFESGLEPRTRAFYDELFASPRHANLMRVRLWSRSGVLLYSNDDFGVGMKFPISNGLRAALDGSVAVQPASQFGPFPAKTMYMSRDGYFRYVTFQEKQVWINPTTDEPRAAMAGIKPATLAPAASQTGVVRLFVPVSLKNATTPSGAFEVFYDFRPMERRLAQVQRTVWTLAPSGFFVLCFGLVTLMQVTTRASHRQDESLRAAHLGTYRALASAVDARDSRTADHSSRVAMYVIGVAQRLGLSPEVVSELEVAARLHDIGKIGVPDDVLMKPGPLTPSQWDLMRQHAVVGSSILHSAPLSQAIKDAVRHVHEWWNGRGYPDSLQGEQIPLFARILAVADAFEAMTSDRPYRPALSSQQALAELSRMRGVQFDPQIVDAFCAWAQIVDLARILN